MMLAAKFPFQDEDTFYYVIGPTRSYVANTRGDFEKIESDLRKLALDSGKIRIRVMNKYRSVESQYERNQYLFLNRSAWEPERYFTEEVDIVT